MRFFKSKPLTSLEQEAAAVRLAAVATRTKAAKTALQTSADSGDRGNDYEPLPVGKVLQ